jgi:hypothetical protein
MQGAGMIDFDALVLSKCEDIFSIAVRFTFAATKPEAAPYETRGIFSSGPYDVALQDETIFSDQQTSLGIREWDFDVVPSRGDLVEIIDVRHPAYGNKYWIGDSDWDGQGGAMLMLRVQQP